MTRSKTLPGVIEALDDILSLATELLATLEVEQKPVRLLGLCLSNLAEEEAAEFVQLNLGFPWPREFLQGGSQGLKAVDNQDSSNDDGT